MTGAAWRGGPPVVPPPALGRRPSAGGRPGRGGGPGPPRAAPRPRPPWSRPDGAEAGLPPCNVRDSAYSVGTVMLAGDMAVVVGPDGPSLGGFAAVAQVIRADLWRLGQLRAGDTVALEAVGMGEAASPPLAAEAGNGGGEPPRGPPGPSVRPAAQPPAVAPRP